MRRNASVLVLMCLCVFVLGTVDVHGQSNGTIVAWGNNYSGQCNVPAPNADFVAVAGGDLHSLGLTSDGTIVAWGDNSDGQCNVPAPNADFVAVAGGRFHSLGLKSDGTIEAWGYNADGQCNVPPPNADFVAAAGGWLHSLGLKSDGTTVPWGNNYYGQCNVPAPNADFVAVAGGGGHSLGLKSDATIVAWGYNHRGQCNVPAPNADFVAVAGGHHHSLGLKSDGTIVAWGNNTEGQCNVPAPNADFVAVARGGYHSLGLKSDGTIVAWGYNHRGQCNVPPPNADFVAAAGGWNHSLGLVTTTVENILCDPDPQYLKAAPSNVQTVDVNYVGGGGGLVYGYSVKFTWDGSVASTAPGSVTEGGLLSGAGDTFFDARSTGTYEITVDCTLLGAGPGVPGPGTMFSIEFTGEDFGTSSVNLTIITVRNKDNNPLSGFEEDDGELIVDTEVPVISDVQIENVTLTHTNAFIKDHDVAQVTATVTDDDPSFAKSNIRADLADLVAGLSDEEPDTYSDNVATWQTMLTDVDCDPENGELTVVVTATDPIGNETTGQDTITADNTVPSELTGLAASPGHEKCELAWDDASGNDTYYSGVLIRYEPWGGYPEYSGVGPSYPADETGGSGEASSGTGTSATHSIVPRDIYYYGGFVYDKARNYSARDAGGGSEDRATNYWLGDVALTNDNWGYDGLVTVNDINKLGGNYGATPPGTWPVPGYDECDVGPTDTGSRVGIPGPDDMIDFEDAMIFAMNYGVVSPRVLPLLPDPALESLALVLAEYGERTGEELELVLRLVGNSDQVKGLSALVSYDPSQLEFVTARLSESVLSPLGDVFFWHGASDGSVRVDVAVLGTGVTIGGSGDVSVLTFRIVCEGDVSVDLAEALLRGVNNEDLDAELAGYESAQSVDLPVAYRLLQNVPNPFNPLTTVAYHVPETSRVGIRIYNASGQLVRTLVDAQVEPGRYSAAWDGRNDSGEVAVSGVYFCTMEASGFRGSAKMLLLK